ncbi:MAG: YqaA family protein [Chloroflexota bacterium]
MELVHDLAHWMLDWVGSPYAPLALFIFAFWESSFFPIPPDPLLIAMAVANPDLALLFALIATIASVTGAMLGYWIGRRGGRPIVLRLFKEEKVRVAEGLYNKYDVWAIGAAALTPIPYKVFTITGGVARLNFMRFIIASIAGRGGRFFAIGILVFFFGASIEQAIDQYFEFFTVGFLVLLVLGFIVIKYSGHYLVRKQAEKDRANAATTD